MARNTDYQASIASIENEINSLLDSLASLKKNAARESRSSLNSFKSTARDALHHSGDSLEEVYDDVRRLTRQYGRAASGVAREHPWATVGIAAGGDVLVGWATAARRQLIVAAQGIPRDALALALGQLGSEPGRQPLHLRIL